MGEQTSTDDEDAGRERMSIGALSRATGVPVATLRSWERRYGFPVPLRLDSGHRRYALDDVERLRLVRRAIELGNRPSDVVAAPLATLTQLVELAPAAAPGARPSAYVSRLLNMARALDEPALTRTLVHAIDELGLRRFLHECAVPFVRELGDAWAAGHLGVMHEHFATARLQHLLAERRLSYQGGDGVVVCAALPGELHDLGLLISALLLALAGLRVVYLGPNTPAVEIGGAALQSAALAVLIGSSRWADPDEVADGLAAVRRLLPPGVHVAAGGGPTAVAGVVALDDFHAVERWAADLARDA